MTMHDRPYRLGQTSGVFPSRACRADRRCSYSIYVPSSPACKPDGTRQLLVLVHGTDRRPEQLRDLYLPLAEELGCVLLAPLFPAALTDDEEAHNFVFLRYRDIRFDALLLSMVEEAVELFNVSAGKFWLAGFSGGAQFANRFAYLHASRLAGVSIASPGTVTLLDGGKDWFSGVGLVEDALGQAVDWAGLRELNIHVAVGSDDTSTEVIIPESSPLFCPGINDSGSNRVERAKRLHDALCEAGVGSQFDLVPNADHVPGALMPVVSEYFRRAFSTMPAPAVHPAASGSSRCTAEKA